MILTTKARYAVMAVLEIWHGHQQNNKVINLSQIALAQNISLSYLEQIFSALNVFVFPLMFTKKMMNI